MFKERLLFLWDVFFGTNAILLLEFQFVKFDLLIFRFLIPGIIDLVKALWASRKLIWLLLNLSNRAKKSLAILDIWIFELFTLLALYFRLFLTETQSHWDFYSGDTIRCFIQIQNEVKFFSLLFIKLLTFLNLGLHFFELFIKNFHK